MFLKYTKLYRASNIVYQLLYIIFKGRGSEERRLRFLFQGVIEKHVSGNAPLRWVGARRHPIPAVARNFVEQLLLGNPAVRLGGKEMGGKYGFIHHAFMWIVVGLAGDLTTQPPACSYPSQCLTVNAIQSESCVLHFFLNFFFTSTREGEKKFYGNFTTYLCTSTINIW